eukprot:Seg130.10 transcript_id=Seg130.10/GoldUCD/mRNA.D3Y31 product="putative protein disulfide-isomerase" protein_id=Seg130.10/GoldUCD/D3Y31
MHSFVILVIFSVFFSTQHLKSSSFEITPEKPTKLTSRNFHIILSLDDPWIVIFLEDYDAAKQAELVALATSVVGLVQIGFVDMDDSESEELVEAKRISSFQIRVYEYGEQNKEMPKRAKTYAEAVEIALESYPDTLERITESTIPAFYSRNMKKQKPRKLPIIYFTNKGKVLPPLRYLAITLKNIFAFSTLIKPSQELMSNFSMTALPQLVILSKLNLMSGAFEMIRYNQEIFGPLNFINMLKFLLGVQNEIGDKKHRKALEKLVGGTQETVSPKNQPGVEELSHSSINRICGPDSTALCVIAFLASDDDGDDMRKKEEILDRVRTSATLKDHHIRYSWINSSCHPHIAEAFDVDLTQLPYVIAVRRNKSLFTNHIGSFSFNDLRESLLNVLSGRRKMSSFDKFPKFLTKDCKITKLQCSGGICKDAKRRKGRRGPKLGGGKTEL